MRTALLLASVLLAAGCSRGTSPAALPPVDDPAVASEAPAAQGTVPAARLRGMLLQLVDAPTLTSRRESASADLTTQATPQLALCTPVQPVAPHEVANVLAKPATMGQAQVFEVLAVFATPAAARQAFDAATRSTKACLTYTSGGTDFRVVDVGTPRIEGTDAVLQYRLTTADVLHGDVRTLAVAGSSLVLLTGYGAPPAGQTLLQFQASVLRAAVRRLGSSGKAGPVAP
ncbi:MAG: hypothetical protein JWN17_3203 [Frankiales bacterium]|nr:hypothetical protein [Frankiales bacterium]